MFFTRLILLNQTWSHAKSDGTFQFIDRLILMHLATFLSFKVKDKSLRLSPPPVTVSSSLYIPHVQLCIHFLCSPLSCRFALSQVSVLV